MSNNSVTRAELQEHLQPLQSSLLEAIRASEERMIRHLEERIAASEERMIRHFDVSVEQLKHDFRGIFSDRTEQLKDKDLDHERRLLRIERRLQIV